MDGFRVIARGLFNEVSNPNAESAEKEKDEDNSELAHVSD